MKPIKQWDGMDYMALMLGVLTVTFCAFLWTVVMPAGWQHIKERNSAHDCRN